MVKIILGVALIFSVGYGMGAIIKLNIDKVQDDRIDRCNALHGIVHNKICMLPPRY